MEGKIKKLIWDRGFGFIASEDGKDIFFHRSSLDSDFFNALKEGTTVEFDLETGPKGHRAVNVKMNVPVNVPMNVPMNVPFHNKEGGEPMQAYCMKCRAKREMKDTKAITMKNGRPATQGVCPTCGTKMFRIGKA